MLHNGFLADINEYPDDDTPRLIYAYWLDENGEPEGGDLIRLVPCWDRLQALDAARNQHGDPLRCCARLAGSAWIRGSHPV